MFMGVDVATTIEIKRPRGVVSAFAADSSNVPACYANVKPVEWRTNARTEVGAKTACVAHFFGRRLEHTYEITEFVPGTRLVMSTGEGPFPMETIYEWDDTPDGSARMSL
jgi:hypothetical protein